MNKQMQIGHRRLLRQSGWTHESAVLDRFWTLIVWPVAATEDLELLTISKFRSADDSW